jgi:hypothetical protein
MLLEQWPCGLASDSPTSACCIAMLARTQAMPPPPSLDLTPPPPPPLDINIR